MAQRPIWRGHLRLALVSCPVALYSARHDRNAIRFNMINPATGNRIKMVSLDAGTEKEVARRDTVKGYEFKKDHYVLFSDEDLDSVKVESSSTMTVEKFVDASSIDPIYYDASYYLAPDGKGSEDVYAVLRKAVEQTGKVALTRIVIAQRESGRSLFVPSEVAWLSTPSMRNGISTARSHCSKVWTGLRLIPRWSNSLCSLLTVRWAGTIQRT